MALKQFTVVQGEDVVLTVNLKVKGSDPVEPLSLAGFTGCTAYFEAATGGRVAVIGTLLSADLGRMAFNLSDSFTTGLAATEEGDVEVEVDQGAQKTIAQILGRLQVKARLFE